MPRYWKEKEVFDCPHCPFDSIDRELRDDHVRKIHQAPIPQGKPRVVLTDRFGNPVSPQE